MLKIKEIKKKCEKCSKDINLKKDHHVLLGTYNTSKQEEIYFHFDCFIKYFNERVEKRMRENVQFMQNKALNLFNSPMLKGILSQVKGSDIAMNMLSLPLDKIDKNKIKEQIEDDRKKRDKKGRK